QAGGDGAAGAVDVEGDVLFRVLGLEEEQLGGNEIGDGVVDRRTDEDDVVAQQARVDVIGALTARGLLDHHGDQAHAGVPSFAAVAVWFACASATAAGKAPPVALPSKNSNTRSWRILCLILSRPPF